MIETEIKKLKEILDVILGDSKQELDDSMQLEYPCPHCIEKYGWQEARKYNLSLSLSKQRFQCWKCSSEGDDMMHGSVKKLIKQFGNDKLLDEYISVIHSIRNSELYKLHFSDGDFNVDTSIIEKEELKLPSSYKLFKKDGKNNYGALKYLQKRGIGWDIIERYKIGYTEREEENKKGSFRIIIPSYNALGELNYWVGRDYLPPMKKMPSDGLNGVTRTFERIKYDNPKVEKKNIIFNEEKLQWDADITLVEGPFDHIVVPNSVPLLGKALNKEYKLYWDLITKANANINIMLDNDAYETAKQIYGFLNHGKLYERIRFIPIEDGEDPSSLYQKGGYREIAAHLANAQQIDEVYLQ